jgi:hypothetical protein
LLLEIRQTHDERQGCIQPCNIPIVKTADPPQAVFFSMLSRINPANSTSTNVPLLPSPPPAMTSGTSLLPDFAKSFVLFRAVRAA